MANTNGHGGKRTGAGRPKKPLADKILEGTLKKHKAKVLDIPDIADMPLPEVPSYLHKYNIDSIDNYVPNMETIYKRVSEWLHKTGCLHLINPEFIEDYVMLKTRFMECESVVAQVMFLKKEKFDSKGKKIPYSTEIVPNAVYVMGLHYKKAADTAWSFIWDIVTANSEVHYGDNPNKDIMAFLIKNKPEA